MEEIDKLLQDMERELSRSLYEDSQLADGIELEASGSNSGDSDERLLSTNIDLSNSFAELSPQTSNSVDSGERLLSTNTDLSDGPAKLISALQENNGDEILPFTKDEVKYSCTEQSQNSKDDDERFTSQEINLGPCPSGLNPTQCREEGDRIIWSTITRLMKGPEIKEKDHSDDESETSLSSNEDLCSLCQDGTPNQKCYCRDEDERLPSTESNENRGLASFSPTSSIKDSRTKPLSDKLDEDRNLPNSSQMRHSKSEDEKFFPVAADSEINFGVMRADSSTTQEDENSSIEIGGIKFRKNKPNIIFGLDEILQLNGAGFTVLSSELEQLQEKDERLLSHGNEMLNEPETDQANELLLGEGIALPRCFAELVVTESEKHVNKVGQDEMILSTDRGTKTSSNELNKTSLEENEKEKFSFSLVDTERSHDQANELLLGEGIALPRCFAEQVVTESSQQTNKVDQDEIIPSTEQSDISFNKLRQRSQNKNEVKETSLELVGMRRSNTQSSEQLLREGIALLSCLVEQGVTKSDQSSSDNEGDERFPPSKRTKYKSSKPNQRSPKIENDTGSKSSKSGFLSVRPLTPEKRDKIEIFVHSTGFRAYTEVGEMNRCTLMDTLLAHRVELVSQFIELINAMVHKEYENRYPLWAAEIRDVRTQLYKIDSRWDLKMVRTRCGHMLIRQYDCTCDPPFNYKSSVSKKEMPNPNKPKFPTIDELMERRQLAVSRLLLIIEDYVIDGYYPQYELSWVVELRKTAQQILNIDPQWKLECIKEQFKCLQIRRVSCDCGHQK